MHVHVWRSEHVRLVLLAEERDAWAETKRVHYITYKFCHCGAVLL